MTKQLAGRWDYAAIAALAAATATYASTNAVATRTPLPVDRTNGRNHRTSEPFDHSTALGGAPRL